MPSYIVAVEPDRDLFVWWSGVCDAPKGMGTQEELTGLIRSYAYSSEADEERFDRARATGCSAMWPSPEDPIYSYGDAGFVAEQRGWLPRARLEEYCQLRLTEDEKAFELLEPFED